MLAMTERRVGLSSNHLTPDLHRAFEECKASLLLITLLSHPGPAVLHKHANDASQPLAFFSKSINPSQLKRSAYDLKLLAVCEAEKHFRHMLEARHIILLADLKPITFAYHQKQDKCSPQMFCDVNFATQFTTGI
jgi:hypothetical protein